MVKLFVIVSATYSNELTFRKILKGYTGSLPTSQAELLGYDMAEIGYTEDLIKVYLYYISLGELQKRTVTLGYFAPKAIGDIAGTHIEKFSLDMPTFLGLLIAQQIHRTFSQPEYKNCYMFLSSKGVFDYDKKAFLITYSAFKTQEDKICPAVIPQILKSAYYFIFKAYNFEDFTYIEVRNTYNNVGRIYSKQAFKALKLQ